MAAKSIVEYFGLGEGHKCGYCGNADTNISHGMWAHKMTCGDYETLLDRGWRRSGKYVYKPLMNTTCCPMYTIRCDVTEFQLSKSQKKVLKKMNKFLMDGKEKEDQKTESAVSADDDNLEKPNEHESTQSKRGGKVRSTSHQEQPQKEPKSGNLESKAQEKLPKLSKGAKKQANKSPVKLRLEDFISETEYSFQRKHKLEIKTVRSHLDSSHFTENLSSEYEVYLKYQVTIHHETESENSKSQFERFLVNSPLIGVNPKPGLPATGLGAFHQQYFLDGLLIAVGVIDILPHCLSSKYFFYDPAYNFLSLGTYSALREIHFIRRLQEQCPDFKYYYMGYYIHSCQKMQYKGNYDPSFLLCPESFKFRPIKLCLEKLNKSKYSRLSPEDETSDDECSCDVDKALILHKGNAMQFQLYAEMFLQSESRKQEEIMEVGEYCQLAGEASQRILLYRK